MPSFDIVSEINFQEVENAINQAKKETESRYDLKGTSPEINWDKKEILLSIKEKEKLSALKDIVQSKVHKRGVDMSALKFEEPTPAGGMQWKQKVTLIQGIERELAKKICKDISASKLKVQPQIQDDKIRVTSKSIDDLQACINLVKNGKYGIPFQFVNMRS